MSTTDGLDLTIGSPFSAVFDTSTLLKRATMLLRDVDFDTFIGRGVSGIVPLALLAHHLNKKFAIVRKPNDDSHSSMAVEGRIGRRWVFVDDFIDKAVTIYATVETIEDQCRFRSWRSDFVGALLYGSIRVATEAQFITGDINHIVEVARS